MAPEALDKYDQKWVRWLFRKDRWAITLFGRTYYSVPVWDVTEAWRRHEDWHKKQQEDEPIWFYPKYLFYNIIKGYQNNPYEIEARRAENVK